MCCNVLQCAAVCCSMMQCDAMCCSVLQCVAVCCSVLLLAKCKYIYIYAHTHAHVCICINVYVHAYMYILHTYYIHTHVYWQVHTMGWLRLVRSIKLQVSFAEYSLFYRALLQKRPIILSILLIEATPYIHTTYIHTYILARRYLASCKMPNRRVLIY